MEDTFSPIRSFITSPSGQSLVASLGAAVGEKGRALAVFFDASLVRCASAHEAFPKEVFSAMRESRARSRAPQGFARRACATSSDRPS